MSGPVQYHEGRFPPTDIDLRRLMPLAGEANRAIAKYDGLLSILPNARVLLSPLTTNEAVLSSKIEGTVATLGEVLQYDVGETLPPADRIDDIQEVQNYRRAMLGATEALTKLPLAGRLVKEAHATLMDGVRGADKTPGAYRKIQNYIGRHGATDPSQMRFEPIAPSKLEDGMAKWEHYLHSRDVEDVLVQLAFVHAEFEALHPFLDGNGRLGRMIVPLFLVEKQVLSSPMFYISDYLEANRQEYVDRLLAVSRDDDWTGWAEFFLRAIIEQAAANERKTRAILALYDQQKRWALDYGGKAQIETLDFIFEKPIFRASDLVQVVVQASGAGKATVQRVLKQWQEADVLMTIEEAAGRRAAVYAYRGLLNIAEGREAF